jgi:adenine-specific DNA-methyltransferase
MELKTHTLRQTLNKAFLKEPVQRADIERFKAGFKTLLERLDADESEENAKTHLRDFLNDTWYKDQHLVATKGRTDLVIHTDSKSSSPAAVLFEVKRLKNTAEMISAANPNLKALHELVLYFMEERTQHHNTDIKYLIATNFEDWYVFDAGEFERVFYKNKNFLKDFEDWKAGRKTQATNDFFYHEIVKPFVAASQETLNATHFRLSDFEKPLLDEDPGNDKKLIPLYKALSPTHLLRLPFANDSNTLDKGFYGELLHLIGLEEAKEGSKKVIRRKAGKDRHPGALLENAIATLEAEDRLRNVPKLTTYGDGKEEQLYNVALELCLTWINRTLFLKLLEAQLVQYHQGDPAYRFLNSKQIGDFDELNELFFEALAKRPEDRKGASAAKFAKVPYLNSSLFEISGLEYDTLRINSLKDRHTLPLFGQTVLKDDKGKRLAGEQKPLEYLFAFLDAYNFSSEGGEEIQEQNKTLINASVLGLIFEKINGYRDGSFYTPGFITMYMCREALRRAVVDRFNEQYGLECEDFSDLQNWAGSKYKTEEVLDMNRAVNSLRICDPAVGSGHFLVSALNELVAIKSELGILADGEGKRLSAYQATVENDELILTHQESQELFSYRLVNGKASPEAQRVQETLFHEKQTLIESCLFGVDINPNSVKICRLRLWIELLKNAYYQPGGQLETLPNIDINIKQGNSLISRFGLEEDLSAHLKKSKWTLSDYRIAISSYQRATAKEEKRQLLDLIERIKGDFQTHIYGNDPRFKQLSKLKGQRYLLENKAEVGDLFEKLKEEDIAGGLAKIDQKVKALEGEIDAIRNAAVYRDAFEWRFEFPEVLDEEGRFKGFDVVIGNPPYIRQEEISAVKPYLQQHYATFAGTADLLVYFIERGMAVLKAGGQFTFIISNKFMRANFGAPLRKWLQQHRLLEILDFGDLPVFEATTYPSILSMQKTAPTGEFRAANIPSLPSEDFGAFVAQHRFRSSQSALSPEGWTLAGDQVQRLLDKLRSQGKPLGEYVGGKIYRGVLTGLNEAFVIDATTRERLIAEDPRSAEVIKPFLAGRDVKRYVKPRADKYLIFARRGIRIEEYPAILRHLEQYKDRLVPRPKDFTGKDWSGRKPGTYQWYEIQDAVDYWGEFERPKILWPGISADITAFAFDQDALYGNDNNQMIITSDMALLGILNSSVGKFYLKNTCDFVRGGFARLKIIYVASLPIPEDRNGVFEEIRGLVEKIIEGPSSPITLHPSLTQAIDRLVYELYGLTEGEVGIVENKTS